LNLTFPRIRHRGKKEKKIQRVEGKIEAKRLFRLHFFPTSFESLSSSVRGRKGGEKKKKKGGESRWISALSSVLTRQSPAPAGKEGRKKKKKKEKKGEGRKEREEGKGAVPGSVFYSELFIFMAVPSQGKKKKREREKEEMLRSTP